MKRILLLIFAFISLNAFAQLQVKEGSFKYLPGGVIDEKEKYTDGNEDQMDKQEHNGYEYVDLGLNNRYSYNHYAYNAYGCYWSSTPYQSSLNNRSYGKDSFGCGSCTTHERYMGFTVRPVSN